LQSSNLGEAHVAHMRARTRVREAKIDRPQDHGRPGQGGRCYKEGVGRAPRGAPGEYLGGYAPVLEEAAGGVGDETAGGGTRLGSIYCK